MVYGEVEVEASGDIQMMENGVYLRIVEGGYKGTPPPGIHTAHIVDWCLGGQFVKVWFEAYGDI